MRFDFQAGEHSQVLLGSARYDTIYRNPEGNIVMTVNSSTAIELVESDSSFRIINIHHCGTMPLTPLRKGDSFTVTQE